MSGLPSGTVTFLFTDLETSALLWDQHPEAMKRALERHDELLASAVAAHGGHVLKHTGDGLLAVFARADAAIAAAVAGQLALGREAWGSIGALRARMGLHTGVAEERAGDYFGPALNRAARLMAVAHPGQVLCSQATADLVRDEASADIGLIELGSHQLRDLHRSEVVFQATHPDLPVEFPRLVSAERMVGNLPRQLTSLVGRESDLITIPDTLADFAIVTLTGVGGVGKTRLALEVATRLGPAFRDGAWLCKLDGVRDADAVPDALLEVFGVRPGQGGTTVAALNRFLRSKQLLLVLDNCEHLLRAVARLVQELVDACEDLRILATSREGLGVPGERMLAVASLEVPEAGDDADSIARCDAVRLFVARATAVRADFVLDASNARAVAQVCTRLDGVPLAIELAAARVNLLTPGDLADRLDHRFHVLTGSEHGAVERHQTLRAAIDWSYDLLNDAERRLLQRLSVFAGGFTLDAAASVGAPGSDATDVLELLGGLVAKSLVAADTHGPQARYRLLETIRQYAEERLDEQGDAAEARGVHAQYFAAFTARAAKGLRSANEAEWLARTAADSDNVRAALTWACETQDADTVVRFFPPLVILGFSDVARVVIAGASAAVAVLGVARDRRFPAMLAAACLHAARTNDLESAQRHLSAALAAQQQLGEWFPEVHAANSFTAMSEGRLSDVQRIERDAIEILRTTGPREPLAMALVNSAMGKALLGVDIALAVAEADEAVELSDEITVPTLRMRVRAFAAFVLADVDPQRARELMHDVVALGKEIPGLRDPVHSVLGDVAERLGEPRRALEYFLLGLDLHRWNGENELAGRMLRRIGLLLVDRDPEPAAMIIAAAMTRSRVSTLTERVNRHHRARVAVLEAALGRERLDSLTRQGARLSDDEAIALAHTAAERALASDETAPEASE